MIGFIGSMLDFANAVLRGAVAPFPLDSRSAAGKYYAPRSTGREVVENREGNSNDPGLLLMISLAAGPKHGHAMLLDVERFAGVRLGPGTLYGALTRLEEAGRR